MTRWPHANWALATGEAAGAFAIDVDPRHGGFDSMKEWEGKYPELTQTLRSRTGGGGRHIFCHYPQDHKVPGRNPWLPGVEIKSDGGYVILPRSEHISGARYQWANWSAEILPAPRELLESLSHAKTSGYTSAGSFDISGVLSGLPKGNGTTRSSGSAAGCGGNTATTGTS
jgi:hypothetical protein